MDFSYGFAIFRPLGEAPVKTSEFLGDFAFSLEFCSNTFRLRTRYTHDGWTTLLMLWATDRWVQYTHLRGHRCLPMSYSWVRVWYNLSVFALLHFLSLQRLSGLSLTFAANILEGRCGTLAVTPKEVTISVLNSLRLDWVGVIFTMLWVIVLICSALYV